MNPAWIALMTLSLPAIAIAADLPPPRITVTGNGEVSTPPDMAEIAWRVHGEGKTADEAVRALADKRRAIDGGLAAAFGRIAPRAGEMMVVEVRGRDCNRGYGTPHLSTEECAIVGYAADLDLTLRSGAPKDAGTMVGLIGRLGGTNPRLGHFGLTSTDAARRAALAAAFRDARAQAEAMASAAGVKLGAIQLASDGSYNARAAEDIVVTASAIPAPPPPPPPAFAPIPVSLTPAPIMTNARVTVTYLIAP